MMLDEEDVYMMEGELEYMGDDEEDIDMDENDKDREEMDVQFETEKGRVKVRFRSCRKGSFNQNG